ncbi:hypothetical protein, variant [Magnaporthiopsis poae ATCC 64411]|nr:hypothetical protein, variant [Magnaporthiopsis poae ATCC 64411]
MASEIHRRRTGKGFRISEEIVMKEEMYEEEEDDLPRYRTLAALSQQLQTTADFHERLSQFGTTDIGVGKLARMREIERQFEESFPQHAAHLSQTSFLGQVGSRQSVQPHQQQRQNQHQQQQESPNRGYSHSPMLDYASQYARERAQSISQPPVGVDMATRRHTIATGAISRHNLHHHLQISGLGDDTGSSSLSPPALTPGAIGSSGSSSSGGNGIETPATTQYQPNFTTATSFASIPATTSMDGLRGALVSAGPSGTLYLHQPHSTASFNSSEAEGEGVDHFLGQGWNGESVFYREPDMYPRDMDLETRDAYGGCFEQRPSPSAGSVGMPHSLKALPSHHQAPLAVSSAAEDYFGRAATVTAGPTLPRLEGMTGQHSAVVTPGTEGINAFFDMEQYSQSAAAAAAATAAAWDKRSQI